MRRRARPVKPRKTPRQARSQATVDAILEAAAQLLDRLGYAGLNTNAIARKAGISIGSLYQYFPNKQAVCAELVRRYMDRQTAAFEKNLEGTGVEDPVVQIRRTVRAAVEIARADLRAATILYHQLRHVPEDSGYLRATRRMERTLASYYEKASGARAFRNPDIAAFLVVNMMGVLLGEAIARHPEWLAQERFVGELSALFIGYLTGTALS